MKRMWWLCPAVGVLVAACDESRLHSIQPDAASTNDAAPPDAYAPSTDASHGELDGGRLGVDAHLALRDGGSRDGGLRDGGSHDGGWLSADASATHPDAAMRDAGALDAGPVRPEVPDDFAPVGCAGRTLSGLELFELFPPTVNVRYFNQEPDSSAHVSRSCSSITGCSTWSESWSPPPESRYRAIAPRGTFELVGSSGLAIATSSDGLFVVSGPEMYAHQRLAVGDEPGTVCKEVLTYTRRATSSTAYTEEWGSSRTTITGPFTTERTYRDDPVADLVSPLASRCAGATSTSAIIASWFEPGSEHAYIEGTVDEVTPRSRRCDDLTGCTPFTEDATPVRFYPGDLTITSPSSVELGVLRRVGSSVVVTSVDFPLTSGAASARWDLTNVEARVTDSCAVVRALEEWRSSLDDTWHQTYNVYRVQR